MASIKEVLEFLLKKDILVKERGRIVLGEYGYMHLGEQDPKQEDKNTLALADSVRNLFPSGVTSGGQYVRSAKRAIEYKLKQFKSQYPEVTDEQIIKATKKYVEDYERTNYQYMKTAEYFIMKDRTSLLATVIENMDEEPEEEKWRGKVV